MLPRFQGKKGFSKYGWIFCHSLRKCGDLITKDEGEAMTFNFTSSTSRLPDTSAGGIVVFQA